MENQKKIGNSLGNDNKSLSSEWNYKKNGRITPFHVSPHSDKKFWWKCKNNHEWMARIADRNSKRKRGCPYCSGKRVCRENSLGEKYPELILEWNKKNSKNPFEFTYGSKKKVWWICDKGHEWETTIDNRTTNKRGCPFCCKSNRRACIDNCLATLNPELAKEWHLTKNGELNPNNITVSSSKKVWWICSTCGKEWQSSVSNRNRLGNGCPFCQGITLEDGTHCDSMAEAYVYLRYKSDGKDFLHHQEYGKELGHSKYDFYFPKQNKYVEVTGYHKGSHHYFAYLRIIVKKRRYVEKIGAKFEFVQIVPNKEITKYVLNYAKVRES